jgi:SAM-dependent methyltransferase
MAGAKNLIMDSHLIEILQKERPCGRKTYQPVLDDWEVSRKDSPERLKYITENLVGKTVLDIGCAEGYFSREIAKLGFKVTAVDNRSNIIEVAKYLTEGLDVTCYAGDWVDIMDQFDNVLYLSVFHNEVKRLGIEGTLRKLNSFRGRVNRLFFEVPGGIKERNTPDYLDFNVKESRKRVEDATGLRIIDSARFRRIIFILDGTCNFI